jgi:ribosomal protein S18 acetylase RimI-like enzyme
MSELIVQPLSLADRRLVMNLMTEEERAWQQELDWDFAPIRRILFSFLEQRLLPGFVGMSGLEALGYVYFLISRTKSVIGTLYASSPKAQIAAETILSQAIDSLKSNVRLQRIESQIIPLNGIDLSATFLRNGFQTFRRHYMELDLTVHVPADPRERPGFLTPWHSGFLSATAAVAYSSYRQEIDAVICDDYASQTSCEAYLRSLVDNPGCGIFQSGSSFVSLDGQGAPCGFILTSKISKSSAMIPQISIHPAHQGRGVGAALIQCALRRLKSEGYKTVRLTVSHENRRAYEWYLRLGFKPRRDFNAYLWRRD